MRAPSDSASGLSGGVQDDGDGGNGIRVAIVDDHAGARHGLALLLNRCGFTIGGEAADAASGLRLLLDVRPDVALVDLVLPDRSGLCLAADIRDYAPELRVLIYTGAAPRGLAVDALAAGASGVLLKEATTQEVAAAIRTVATGGVIVDGRLESVGPTLASELTPREREILQQLADGLATNEIAQRLVLSTETVSTHIRNAMRRIGARTRAQAVAIALRDGVIDPASSRRDRGSA